MFLQPQTDVHVYAVPSASAHVAQAQSLASQGMATLSNADVVDNQQFDNTSIVATSSGQAAYDGGAEHTTIGGRLDPNHGNLGSVSVGTAQAAKAARGTTAE